MPKHALVIDDEPDTVKAAIAILKDHGFSVTSANHPEKGLKEVDQRIPDLILLDVRMPDMDGFEVCRRLKSRHNTKAIPLIIMSSHEEEVNVVTALELGADDFIHKPVRQHELMARVKAIFRRRAPTPDDQIIEIGPLKLNVGTYVATINNKPLSLEPKEFQILQLFAQREGRVITRSTISETVWSMPHITSSHAVETRVYELRKKLGKYGYWIESLKGIGYRFEVEE